MEHRSGQHPGLGDLLPRPGTLLVTWSSPACAALAGELDLTAVPAMHALWEKAPASLELDCFWLHFVDPSGLRLLSLTHRLCQARGGDLVLVSPAQCLRRLISLTNSDLAQKVVRVPRLDLA